HGVELSIGLLSRESFGERSGEARDNAVIPAQTVVGFFPGITARQRNYPQDFGMFDELGVEVVLLRERQLEHDQLACWQLIKLLKNSRPEQFFRFRLFRAVNVTLRLDDRHQSSRNDLGS